MTSGDYGAGVITDSGTVTVGNSLVDLGAHSYAVGLDATNLNAGTTPKTIRADHVTVVGGGPNSTGFRVFATAAVSGGSQTSTGILTNSVIHGPTVPISREAQNSAGTNPGTNTANVKTRYSNYKASDNTDVTGTHGAGSITAKHFVPGTPKFVSSTNFHPAKGSILVDSGDPLFTGGRDLAGKRRVADGDGNGSKITDLGAYERQK